MQRRMVRTKNVDVHQREALSAPLLANANRVRAAAPVVQGIVRHIRGSATATPTSPCHFDSFGTLAVRRLRESCADARVRFRGPELPCAPDVYQDPFVVR